jgi:hypothetical protein
MTAAILIALVSAVIGAIVGAYLQKRWTPDYSSELTALRRQVAAFQQPIETLEQERIRSEELARFKPSAEIVGQLPEGQCLRLKAHREFALKRTDYLSDNDAMVAYNELNLSGQELELPIDKAKIVQIFNFRPRTAYIPIPIKFRCQLIIDGTEKVHTIEVLIKPEFKPITGTQTSCFTVTLGL